MCSKLASQYIPWQNGITGFVHNILKLGSNDRFFRKNNKIYNIYTTDFV